MSGIARKSAEIFSVRLLSQAVGVVIGVLVARAVGPYGKGVYTYAVTILGLVITLAMGQAAAVAYEYGRLGRDARHVHRSMLLTTAVFGLPIAAGLAGYGFLQHSWAYAIVGLIVPFTFYGVLANNLFLADGDVHFGNVQTLVTSGVLLAGVAAAMLLHAASVPAIMLVWCASYVCAWFYAIARVAGKLAKSHEDRGTYPVREQWMFGFKSTANAVVAYLNFRIDAFILIAMLGTTALGVYSLGIGVGELVWQLSRPVASAALQRIGKGTQAEAAELTARCLRHTLILVCTAALVLFIVAPWLIVVVYGPAFAEAGSVLRWLLPGIIAYCAMPLFGTFFTQQMGKPGIPLLASSVSLVICTAASYVLIPRLGMAGGAIATSASYVVSTLVIAYVFMRANKVDWRELVVPTRADIARYKELLRAAALRAGFQRA